MLKRNPHRLINMSRHGSPGHPATTPSFSVYVTVDFARTNHATPATALEGRRATIDAMLGLVQLCESNGWDFRELGVGGRDSGRKTLYRVEGDLVDAPVVVPAVAAAVGWAAVMHGTVGFPATKEDKERFEEFCKARGILPMGRR
jgi:hypothetical protein